MAESKPIDLNQAMIESNWLAAIWEELRTIEGNKTRELIERTSKKPIDVKWDYKLKLRPNSEISEYKEKIVAIGFLQKIGIDFNEVYAIVSRFKDHQNCCGYYNIQKYGRHIS